MKLFDSMPFITKKVAKFFLEQRDHIYKDYFELFKITRRENFAKNTLKKFEKEKVDLINFLPIGVYIEFENITSFMNNIPGFCLSLVHENHIMVYDPILHNFYWGDQNCFYINHIQCRQRNIDDSLVILDDRNISDSLKVVYLLAGRTDAIVLKNSEKYQNILSIFQKEENLYFYDFYKDKLNNQ